MPYKRILTCQAAIKCLPWTKDQVRCQYNSSQQDTDLCPELCSTLKADIVETSSLNPNLTRGGGAEKPILHFS